MDVNVITSFIAMGMMALVCRAFFPLFKMGLAVWVLYIIAGLIMVFAMVSLRSLYWDVGQALAGENWKVVRAAVGGQKISTVFNVGITIACIAFLYGRYLLIPLPERNRWHWWSAWYHPGDQCIIRWFSRKRKG